MGSSPLRLVQMVKSVIGNWLMPGTDIAVSDDAGLTIYSLVDDTHKKLEGIKVINITCVTNLGCWKLDILT